MANLNLLPHTEHVRSGGRLVGEVGVPGDGLGLLLEDEGTVPEGGLETLNGDAAENGGVCLRAEGLSPALPPASCLSR